MNVQTISGREKGLMLEVSAGVKILGDSNLNRSAWAEGRYNCIFHLSKNNFEHLIFTSINFSGVAHATKQAILIKWVK